MRVPVIGVRVQVHVPPCDEWLDGTVLDIKAADKAMTILVKLDGHRAPNGEWFPWSRVRIAMC